MRIRQNTKLKTCENDFLEAKSRCFFHRDAENKFASITVTLVHIVSIVLLYFSKKKHQKRIHNTIAKIA